MLVNRNIPRDGRGVCRRGVRFGVERLIRYEETFISSLGPAVGDVDRLGAACAAFRASCAGAVAGDSMNAKKEEPMDKFDE